ncbi:acyltransferase [Curtobacterium luteum]|uniref:acyltransferase family protein n=1 Tax=Curtobacterium luteum TaxID=33881 RepID=UPI00381D177C
MNDPAHIRPIGRDNTITFLRLVIAVGVVLEHCMIFIPSVQRALPFWIQGRMFFLIVTGMLLYPLANRLTTRTGWVRFYTARWARLAPPLVIFFALVPVVFVLFRLATVDSVLDWHLVPFIAQGFVLLPRYELPTTAALGGVTDHLWTLVVDVTFFVLLPFLVAFARRFGFWWMIAGLSVVAVAGSVSMWCISVYVGPSADLAVELLHHSFAYYAYVVGGMMAAALWHRVPLGPVPVIAAAVVSVTILMVGPLVPVVYGPLKPVLLAVPLAYLVVAGARLLPRGLERFAIRIGDLSYPVYVLQGLVIIVVRFSGVDGLPAIGIVLVSTVALAWLVTRVTTPLAVKIRTVGDAVIDRRARLGVAA